MTNIGVSPCSNPELPLEKIMEEYSKIGYRKMELFTSSLQSAIDFSKNPDEYKQLSERYGIGFTSMHLPRIVEDQGESLDQAVSAALFAAGLGIKIVLFKCESKAVYISSAKRFLDAIEGLDVIPVLQNHVGSPISSLEDYSEVIRGIGDSRMKTLLEVGHFHSAGVNWRDGYDLLGDSIALIHIKDQIGSQSVAFGKGEIDLLGLFKKMNEVGYSGDYIVEMEVSDKENTIPYLKAALSHIQPWV
jgi:sugar phosphate isomerase/epimerase